MLGGIATLLTTVLLTAGETVVHVPGKAVNRARTGSRSGDNKSDPRDARTIAGQVRTRQPELHQLTHDDERVVALKTLVTRRQTLIAEEVAHHPDGPLIQSLPGMGVVTAAECLAHAGSMIRYASAHHLAA